MTCHFIHGEDGSKIIVCTRGSRVDKFSELRKAMACTRWQECDKCDSYATCQRMFKGYCFIEKDGIHCPPVELKDASEVYSYVNLQKRMFPEVRITDDGDFCVVHAIDGKIVFPPEWVKLEQFEEGGEPNVKAHP